MRSKPYFTKSDLIAEERPPIHATAVYDTNQAAAIIGIAPITLRRAMDTGEIRHLEIGRRVLFTGAHLLDWLAAREVNESSLQQQIGAGALD